MWTSMSSNDNMISDMFKVALQLEEPWKLTHIEFDDQGKRRGLHPLHPVTRRVASPAFHAGHEQKCERLKWQPVKEST
ncbi:hypothetical protein O9H85_21620 [Paenibacillus filicis]|uniref:Uncharacterized protein n=1 Tax=Paenibacillus gyeongsangnamensis TaxID=3388067 RepID=A0ABT4QDV5_9BACL|nr:hypothetical protein [Paenibacillus filicis]MCZ8514972.1 hypothetical protein [Paenibacillus filicis]